MHEHHAYLGLMLGLASGRDGASTSSTTAACTTCPSPWRRPWRPPWSRPCTRRRSRGWSRRWRSTADPGTLRRGQRRHGAGVGRRRSGGRDPQRRRHRRCSAPARAAARRVDGADGAGEGAAPGDRRRPPGGLELRPGRAGLGPGLLRAEVAAPARRRRAYVGHLRRRRARRAPRAPPRSAWSPRPGTSPTDWSPPRRWPAAPRWRPSRAGRCPSSWSPEAGELAPPGDVDALAGAIRLRHGRDRGAVRRARRAALLPDRMVDEYERLYAGSGHGGPHDRLLRPPRRPRAPAPGQRSRTPARAGHRLVVAAGPAGLARPVDPARPRRRRRRIATD